MLAQPLQAIKVSPTVGLMTWLVFLLSLTQPSLEAQRHPPYQPFNRDVLRQQKYVLFVFCTGDDKRMEKQFALLRPAMSKLKARGVLPLDEFEESLLPEVQEDLRHYQVKTGEFKIVLLNRAAKTLYISHQPISSAQLFKVLDASVASKPHRPQH